MRWRARPRDFSRPRSGISRPWGASTSRTRTRRAFRFSRRRRTPASGPPRRSWPNEACASRARPRASMEDAVTSPWLFGRRADLLLFGGSTALALLFLGIGHVTGLLDGDAPPWLFLVAVVGVDVAHVWATGWRVLADGKEARRRSALYLGVPIAAWAAGVVAYSVSALFFWRLLAYLAVFHFVRQQYGWVALYRRKNGEGGGGRLLDAAAIYGATLTPLLFWHAHLPRRFQWFLREDFVNGLPAGVSRAAFVLYAGIFAAWDVKET